MLVSDVRCGDLHCRVEGKHHLTFCLFGLTKQNLNGCRLHGNEEIEAVVRNWFRTQVCFSYRDTVFKHLTKYKKYIKAFVNFVETKNDTVVGVLSSLRLQ